MTRAFAAVVTSTAAVGSLFGALGLWLLGTTSARPGVLGVLVIADAIIVLTLALLALRADGSGSLRAGFVKGANDATPLGAAVLGAALAIPLFALHGSYVTDTDSNRILASAAFVSKHGPEYLRRTQDVVLPQLLFRPAVTIGGLAGARDVPILGTLFLAAVVAGLAFAITRRLFGAIVAACVIICMKAVLRSAVELPLYEDALAFGYLGGWSAYQALRAETRQRCITWAISGALFLALAVESQGTGQLFLLGPALVFACFAWSTPWRTTRRALLWVYGSIAVAMLPRLVSNLSIGGIHHLTSTRNEFMVTQGYLRIVNTDFWKYPVGVSISKYVGGVPNMIGGAVGLGLGTLAILLLMSASLFHSKWSSRIFVVACLAVFTLALVKTKPPPFDRYASPLLPGAALLAAVGAVQLYRRGYVLRIAAMVALVAVVTAGTVQWRVTSDHYRSTEVALLDSPAAKMLPAITDHRGVIGVRASKLVGLNPDLLTWGTSTLTEEEWKTYLLWPSDRLVLAMLAKHNIGWIAVLGGHFLEVSYNDTWTEKAYGRGVRARHELGMSPNFCQRWRHGFNALYQVGPCVPAAGAPPAAVTTPTTTPPSGADSGT